MDNSSSSMDGMDCPPFGTITETREQILANARTTYLEFIGSENHVPKFSVNIVKTATAESFVALLVAQRTTYAQSPEESNPKRALDALFDTVVDALSVLWKPGALRAIKERDGTVPSSNGGFHQTFDGYEAAKIVEEEERREAERREAERREAEYGEEYHSGAERAEAEIMEEERME